MVNTYQVPTLLRWIPHSLRWSEAPEGIIYLIAVVDDAYILIVDVDDPGHELYDSRKSARFIANVLTRV
jgi:hypothetical protein